MTRMMRVTTTATTTVLFSQVCRSVATVTPYGKVTAHPNPKRDSPVVVTFITFGWGRAGAFAPSGGAELELQAVAELPD